MVCYYSNNEVLLLLGQNLHHTSLTDDERSSIKDGLKINNVIIEDAVASLLSVVEVLPVLRY